MGKIRLLGLGALVLVLAVSCSRSGVTPIRTHFNKGVYHHSRGDYEAAISEYRQALEEDPADYRARFNLASALEGWADLLERAGETDEAADLHRRAVEHYRRILSEHPENVRATVNLAAREIAAGERAAGEERLRRAIEKHPRSSLPRAALAAHALREARDDPAALRRAVELLEGALEIDPKRLETNMLLGEAYGSLARLEGADPDDLKKAREAYARALDQDPHDLATLLALGRLELAVGEAPDAEPWLRRALYIAPHHLEAHVLISEALEKSGDLEGATFHLWRARELEDPRAPHLEPEVYEARLLELYERLEAREK